MSRKVLVLGGSGYMGRHVCEALLREGARVVSVSRGGGGARPVGGVDYLRADALGEDWHAALEGAHGVVSCVGVAASFASLPIPYSHPGR